MKVAIHINNRAHQVAHGEAMKAGMERHGLEVEFAPFNDPRPCDVAVVWGWRQRRVIKSPARKLVMERAHVPDRFAYTSIGWDGLANRGRYYDGADGGARWRERYGHLMKPWGSWGYALVIGQVRGDASIYGVDFDRWQQDVTDRLLALGWDVAYRPHPLMVRNNQQTCPKGAGMTLGSLDDDLSRAGLVVTFNSTTGVEAVLAGVPTVTMDEGGMARPVALHDLPAPGEVPEPDREPWAHRLAWTSWSMAEIESGDAWAALAEV